jgi:hypothetical protein
MGDERTVGGPAQIRLGDAADGGIAVEAAAFRRNRRRDKGARTVTSDPLVARKNRKMPANSDGYATDS